MCRGARLAAVASLVLTTAASASTSPGIGHRESGVVVRSTCARGAALVGFVGAPTLLFGNLVVGRIRAVCARPPRLARRTIGKSERTSVPHRCPSGMVASGIAGREGDLVDRVRLICHWLDTDRQRFGRTALTSATGGLGGHLAIVSCPRAGYATGFVGHIRTVGIPIIDFVRLRCVG